MTREAVSSEEVFHSTKFLAFTEMFHKSFKNSLIEI